MVVNYRDERKVRRAEQTVAKVTAAGGSALAVRADLTDADAVRAMFETVREAWGGLDLLVLNASGGMESGMAKDYALLLNRDAQVAALRAALPLMAPGSRVVFVTSHQAAARQQHRPGSNRESCRPATSLDSSADNASATLAGTTVPGLGRCRSAASISDSPPFRLTPSAQPRPRKP